MNTTAIGKIDTHAHYLPPDYIRAGVAAMPDGPDGMPGFPPWSAARALELMDELDIATSVLSVSSPGVHFGDDAAARALARSVNESGARAMQDHPGRFGLFASLPLRDVDGALAEIEYALDTLGAHGVVVLSNAQGTYLGDAAFDPVFDELGRRNAVVFMHPTSPYCPSCHLRGRLIDQPFLRRAILKQRRGDELDEEEQYVVFHNAGMVFRNWEHQHFQFVNGQLDADANRANRATWQAALSSPYMRKTWSRMREQFTQDFAGELDAFIPTSDDGNQ